jgi:hypothetical protein
VVTHATSARPRGRRLGALGVLLAIVGGGAWTCELDPSRQPPAGDLPRSIDQVLAAATELELFALDPWSEDAEQRTDVPILHDFTVLGQRTVSAPEVHDLRELVLQGIHEPPKLPFTCFEPRHGLRARAGGHVAELVICYECARMRTYLDGRRLSDVLTGNVVEPKVTALYEAHGLKIAPHGGGSSALTSERL